MHAAYSHSGSNTRFSICICINVSVRVAADRFTVFVNELMEVANGKGVFSHARISYVFPGVIGVRGGTSHASFTQTTFYGLISRTI